MSTTDNKTLVRRFIKDVLQDLDAEAIDGLLADGFESHTWQLQGDQKAGLKKVTQMMRATLSDISFNIEDLIAEDDRVVARLTASATPTAEFQGVPPSGRSYTIEEIHIFRVVDGKLAEHWHEYDKAGMIEQLSGENRGGRNTSGRVG
jgi:steroid delta-isomerase-like uncharacterized protein